MFTITSPYLVFGRKSDPTLATAIVAGAFALAAWAPAARRLGPAHASRIDDAKSRRDESAHPSTEQIR